MSNRQNHSTVNHLIPKSDGLHLPGDKMARGTFAGPRHGPNDGINLAAQKKQPRIQPIVRPGLFIQLPYRPKPRPSVRMIPSHCADSDADDEASGADAASARARGGCVVARSPPPTVQKSVQKNDEQQHEPSAAEADEKNARGLLDFDEVAKQLKRLHQEIVASRGGLSGELPDKLAAAEEHLRRAISALE